MFETTITGRIYKYEKYCIFALDMSPAFYVLVGVIESSQQAYVVERYLYFQFRVLYGRLFGKM